MIVLNVERCLSTLDVVLHRSTTVYLHFFPEVLMGGTDGLANGLGPLTQYDQSCAKPELRYAT